MDSPIIADELGRQRELIPVDLSWLKNKRVLVTGAGGSIGGELCRQLKANGVFPFMLDRNDNGLCKTLYALDPMCDLTRPEVVLCDIRDTQSLDQVFQRIKPQVVFHAAAQKDVVLCQAYPDEAVKNNILGTANVLSVAASIGVQLFLNISTDKAADPSNVMGATKRVAERLVATAAERNSGRYISVRFGNVLGSTGSVVDVFRKQVDQGGPVTLTHPDVERYFMTLGEAVSLVLTAAETGKSGECVVLDMGESLKIMQVIKSVMAESGVDVPVTVTGLRPGEKIAEVLFGADEVPYRFSDRASAVRVPPTDQDVHFWRDWAVQFASKP